MVFETLQSLLAEQLEISEDEIEMDTNIIDDLGADSLDVTELIATLEDEFHIVIVDEDIHKCYTVREVVDFLEKLL